MSPNELHVTKPSETGKGEHQLVKLYKLSPVGSKCFMISVTVQAFCGFALHH